MISIPPGVRVMVAARPVDFRMGMDGLAAVVERALAANPFAGDLFVFRSRRADRVKIVFWDGSGLCLYHKRLEAGRFVWPPASEGAVRLSATQLTMLLEGLDWSRVVQKRIKTPSRSY